MIRKGSYGTPKRSDFPRSKAETVRLQALSRLLDYAYHHGVGVVVLEDLDRTKRKRFTRFPSASRKIARFPKRKLLQHAAIMALKYGFKVYLVDPVYTSNVGESVDRELGLDKHTASAYMLTLRYLGLEPKTLKIAKIP